MKPSTSKRIRSIRPDVAVAYMRVSTAEQRLGCDAQRGEIQRMAAQEGLTIVAWHEDKGVSGVTPMDERPGLLAAFHSLQEHRAGVLIAAKRDRLARDVVVAATIQRLVLSYGAQLMTTDGAGTADTPEANFMRTLMDAMAQFERALIRSRTSAALQAKRKRGELAGGVPYGWVADAHRRLQPNPQEQTVIRIVRGLAAQGLSIRRIAGKLELAGIQPRGARWHHTTIVRIQKEGVLHGEQT